MNKRQKPEDAVPAFSDTISNFAVEETLRFEAGGRLAVVLGKLDGRDCVLELKQRAALADPQALEDALPKLKLTLTNHSGAEYSYYAATDPTTGATYDLEAVWPAPERLVQRKRPAEICVVEETAEAYDRVVRPFAEAQAAKIGWIDAVCACVEINQCVGCSTARTRRETLISTQVLPGGVRESERRRELPAGPLLSIWCETSLSGGRLLPERRSQFTNSVRARLLQRHGRPGPVHGVPARGHLPGFWQDPAGHLPARVCL